MTLLLPEYLQNGSSYSAAKDRYVQQHAGPLAEGILGKGDFSVSQRTAGGANMSVDIAAGSAWVQGDGVVRQGMYHVVNDNVVNAVIAASNATNPRIDRVELKVNDSSVSGAADNAVINVVTGTPTAGASLANLNGVGAATATALTIAYVLVPAGSSSVLTTNIGNAPNPFNNGGFGPPTGARVGAPPQYAFGHAYNIIPTFQIGRSTSTAVPTASRFTVGFTNTYIDTDTVVNLGAPTTPVVIQTPGIYRLSFIANFQVPTGNAAYEGRILVNGTPVGFDESFMTGTTVGGKVRVERLYKLYAGDSLSADLFHTQGSTQTVDNNNQYSLVLDGIWVGI